MYIKLEKVTLYHRTINCFDIYFCYCYSFEILESFLSTAVARYEDQRRFAEARLKRSASLSTRDNWTRSENCNSRRWFRIQS